MFGFSALYHRKKASIVIKQRLRKLDHTGIFLMIAGTFTPMCLLSLPIESGTKLLIIIWSDFDKLVNHDLLTPHANIEPGSCIPG